MRTCAKFLISLLCYFIFSKAEVRCRGADFKVRQNSNLVHRHRQGCQVRGRRGGFTNSLTHGKWASATRGDTNLRSFFLFSQRH